MFGPAERGQLAERLVQADRVSGYNLGHWDLPLLAERRRSQAHAAPLARAVMGRANDLCGRIALAMHRDPASWPDVAASWPLGDLARGTLGVTRVGTGWEAALYWRRGEWPPALSYGLEDAGLVKELVLFVERYGYVVHAGTGQKLDLRPTSPRSPLADMDPLAVLARQPSPRPG